MLAAVVVACSSPIPTEPSTATSEVTDASVPLVGTDVRAPLGRAPGRCGEFTQFAFVIVGTLRDLGFDDQQDDPDYDRPGQFWVTAQKLAIRMPVGLPNVLNRIPGRKRPMPMRLPDRPPARLMCVEWADGNDVGMSTLTLPDDWSPPAN